MPRALHHQCKLACPIYTICCSTRPCFQVCCSCGWLGGLLLFTSLQQPKMRPSPATHPTFLYKRCSTRETLPVLAHALHDAGVTAVMQATTAVKSRATAEPAAAGTRTGVTMTKKHMPVCDTQLPTNGTLATCCPHNPLQQFYCPPLSPLGQAACGHSSCKEQHRPSANL